MLLAFTGGLLAFISPCCLPLYPSFISYITGVSINELKNEKFIHKKTILLHSLFFSIGFSTVYYMLGFSVSSFGQIFMKYQDLIRMLGGVFIVAMGLFLLGVIKPQFMMKDFRIHHQKRNASFFNSMIVGVIFSAGWTPCIGPIFGAIMYANVLNPTQTFVNVTAYSMGFCIPFIIMAFFIGKTKFILKYSSKLMKIGGTIMILIGIMLYFDKMYIFNAWSSIIQYYLYDLFGM